MEIQNYSIHLYFVIVSNHLKRRILFYRIHSSTRIVLSAHVRLSTEPLTHMSFSGVFISKTIRSEFSSRSISLSCLVEQGCSSCGSLRSNGRFLDPTLTVLSWGVSSTLSYATGVRESEKFVYDRLLILSFKIKIYGCKIAIEPSADLVPIEHDFARALPH